MDYLKYLNHFNTEEGLLRVGEDEEFYGEMLRALYRDFRTSPEDFEACLTRRNYDEARVIVHSVRGSAGNLGARDLHISAGDLEEGLKKDPSTDLSQLTERFRRDHSDVMKEIENSGLLEAPGDLPPGNRESLRILLIELKAAASARKAVETRKILSEISAYDWSAALEPELQSSLKDLEGAVGAYRLPEAASLAAGLVERLVPLP